MKKLYCILTLFLVSTIFNLTYAQLTGYWQSDVGGCYEIRQDGNEVWWVGESTSGEKATVVFRGVLMGNTISGQWCDMPSHYHQNCGETLTLQVENNNRFVKTGETISYSGSVWTRTNSKNCADCSVIWQRDLVTCSPMICGEYPANKGDYSVRSGNAQITVCSDGTVKINMTGIINRQTGKAIGAKTFEVYYGTFGKQTWNGRLIERITTDANGNFNGKLNVKLTPPISQYFVLNSDGHSQFITR